MYESVSFMARGDILPGRFIKQYTTEAGCAVQCDNNTLPCGVALKGTDRVPLEGLVTTFHATNGTMCGAYTNPTHKCDLLMSGNYTAGDLIRSNATGAGVSTTASGAKIGARALTSGTDGTFAKVEIFYTTIV